MRPPDLVHRFLTSIGRPAEAQTYLDFYRSERPESFALVVVADEIAEDGTDALGADLRVLSELGLRPVVAFSPRELDRAVARLAPALALHSGDVDAARRAARAGDVPALALRDRDDLVAAATALGSRKIVYLTAQSGLQVSGEPVRSLVDLTTDLPALGRALPPEQAALLDDIDHVVAAVPQRVTVAVTSPFDLLRELFTVKGAGTLVRRGARVSRHRAWSEVDRERLEAVIASAFGRPVLGELFERPVTAIYVAEDYRGAAVVEARPLCPYLSKFAVDVRARGEGVGGDLWRALSRDCPRLLWRSRAHNPITTWYEHHCDGLVREGDWHVFWRGLRTDEITWAVELALDAPIDF